MVVFAPQNIIMDPPFTRIDIISCRNLLIYLTQETQKKLLVLFHHSLNQDGFLFLGSAESIGVLTDLFESLKGKSRLYRRLESTQHKELFQFPSPGFRFPPGEPGADKALSKRWKHALNLENMANQLTLQRYSPAVVLVNEMGDVLYTSGRVGRYLEPAAGKANWNIFVMTHKSLCYKLSRAFQKAVSQNSTIILKNVKIGTAADAEKQVVDITIEPLKKPEMLRHLVMIVFTDIRVPVKKKTGKTSRPPAHRNRVAELELELQQSLQELHSVRQEMQSSQEELLSAYEELQSTNEELQSFNEEMTTSKEELQSSNEELQTLNYELQTKVDELFRANNDMKNLLESTDIATLFLDNALCVRRFTARTAKIFKLISGDVGRPITDIVSILVYPGLAKDAEEVLRTLVFVEKEVTTSNGRWCTVRIMPYRTLENKIDGLVLTFTDITAFKELEAALRQTQVGLKKRITNKETELNKTKKRLQSEIQQKK